MDLRVPVQSGAAFRNAMRGRLLQRWSGGLRFGSNPEGQKSHECYPVQYPGAAWTGVNHQGREKRRRWNEAGEVNPRLVDGLCLMRWRSEISVRELKFMRGDVRSWQQPRRPSVGKRQEPRRETKG